MARSMLSSGMFSALAASMAVRRRALPAGSPPPCLAAMVISRMRRVKTAPRFWSVTAFFRLICFHLLWQPCCWKLQLDRARAPQVGFSPMRRSIPLLLALGLLAVSCERRDRDAAAERAFAGRALRGVLAYPRSSLVSISAGN